MAVQWTPQTAYDEHNTALMTIPLDGGQRVVIDTLKPKGRKWQFLVGMSPLQARKLGKALIYAADVADANREP